MSQFQGLENLAPTIIKFPFVETMKALVDLKLRRKISSSIARIIAFILGLAAGYVFPEIGGGMSFFLNLFFTNPLNSAVVSGVTMVCSMVLSASALMFITKKVFQHYYLSKYGISNPELRLTERDKKILKLKYLDDGLDEDTVKQKIQQIHSRINYLVNKIRIYKITEQEDKRKTAKYALNCLKRGDKSVFDEYYESDYYKKNTKIKKLDRAYRNSQKDDDNESIASDASVSTRSTNGSAKDRDKDFSTSFFQSAWGKQKKQTPYYSTQTRTKYKHTNKDYESVEDEDNYDDSYDEYDEYAPDLSSVSSDNLEEETPKRKNRKKVLPDDLDSTYIEPARTKRDVSLKLNLYGFKGKIKNIKLNTQDEQQEELEYVVHRKSGQCQ